MAKSADLIATEAALEAQKQNHQKDLDIVFKALHDESEERNWCYEYNEFVEGVVSRLSVKPTEGVEREIELDVLGHTVKVFAMSEREAIDKLHTFLSDHTYSGVLETE
jgi:hypothetical protein